jgi:nucleotide-binding universal stress UspA family protein
MLRNVLVPLDGSSFGEHALPLAVAVARKAGAKLHIAHVHIEPPPAVIAGVAVLSSADADTRKDEVVYLEGVRRRLAEAGTVNVETGLLEGNIASALADYAGRVQADLIVMSTHGRGALIQFFLGSIADDVVRAIPRPILLVRAAEGQADLQASLDGKPIVVPLDGTPFAEEALGPAREMARLFSAPLMLTRVVEPIHLPPPEGLVPAEIFTRATVEELDAEAFIRRKEAQAYLDAVAAKLGLEGFSVSARVVVDEEPARGVAHAAQDRHAGMIALETHARSGLSWLWSGSVAEAVIRAGDVPVLLSRPA